MAMRLYLLERTAKLLGSLFVFVFLLSPAAVLADSYQVNASVAFPTPTQAADFDSSLDGTTVQAALQTVSGTCQVANPVNTVLITRGGSSVGSTPCSGGAYSLQITLVEGANTLVARTVNPTGQYGPDSTPITMTLYLPPTVTPTPNTPVPSAPASTPQEVTAKTNSGAAADLTIVPTQPFGVMNDQTNEVTITVTVGGGTTPYTVRINWGDGSVDTHNIDLPGQYTFSHTYEEAGNYTVRGSVQDVLGATTVFNYAVVSTKTTADSTHGSKKLGGLTAAPTPVWHQYATPLAFAIVGIGLLVGAYWLGVHQMAAKILRQTQNNRKRPTRRVGTAKRTARKRR
jgi:hypothetical protein